MFDIGFWELGLIMLLALLIVGPERLPGLVSTVGNWAGRAKFMARSLRMQVERELAREVEESKTGGESPASKPAEKRTPVQEAAEAAQAAEEEALRAARAKHQDVQEIAESRANEQRPPE